MHGLRVLKKRTCVLHDLKPNDVDCHAFACEQVLQRQEWKDFLHPIVMGEENEFITAIQREKSLRATWSCFYVLGSAQYSGCKALLCILRDQVDVMHYEQMNPNETISGERYGTQLMRSS